MRTPTTTLLRNNEVKSGQASEQLDVRVRAIQWEADSVVSLVLISLHGGTLPEWQPGAHVDVQLSTDLSRSYSLSGDPRNRLSYRISVGLEDAGRGGSAFVHQSVHAGDVLTISCPKSNFEFVDAEAYLFLAGGIGITPLLPMITLAEARGRPWRLSYAVPSRDVMPFSHELGLYGSTVGVYASDEGSRLSLFDHIRNTDTSTAIYCCGPERMIDEAEQIASAVGQRVRTERFRGAKLAPARREGAFEVRCARSAKTVTVNPDDSVLDALEANGIPVVSSCREGACGTCELTVLHGEVDHRDSILSPEEKQANETMMVCVSRAVSEELELDV
ncbi:oxidoreductase [Arthrobacter sp. MYb23]|uniref:PDR/VanB family oxidoreductase n=1 Tax=unclassified Arthrobacter TaxID=235627 RepID=UPI000CFCDBDB|nr:MULTISPECIES: PDR/VanB family oxidoreductase [unclassified Arthrobacter]PRB43053.1 oxidoreductase [Arthrobacter sp. MYb51]PRB98005.1 oxidoreductase [Arthrobacter sp. MYb23]